MFFSAVYLLLLSSFLVYTQCKVANDTKNLNIKYVDKCCSFKSNYTELLNCVSKSAEQNLVDGWNINSNSKKFAFVTYGTDDVIEYSSYAFAVNEAYAEQNNILFNMADPAVSNYEPADVRWNKVKILESSLNTWASDCDYIVWLDADLIIIDIFLDLNVIIKKNPKAELIASASPESTTNSDVMNSGMLILKNSKYIKDWLLKVWWTHSERSVYSDQEVFNKLYQKYSKKMTSNVLILPPDAINSDPPATLKQTAESSVLHLMGEYNGYRRHAFLSAFDDICRVVVQPNDNTCNNDNDTTSSQNVCTINSSTNTTTHHHSQLRPQLSVHQKRLMTLALTSYSNKSMELMKKFETNLLHQQFNEFKEYNLLTFYVKRYIDILNHIETTWSYEDVKHLKTGHWTEWDEFLLKEQNLINNNANLNLVRYTDIIWGDINQYKISNKSILGTHTQSSNELRLLIFDLLMRNLYLYKYTKTGKIYFHHYPQYRTDKLEDQLSDNKNNTNNNEITDIDSDSDNLNIEQVKFDRSSLLYFVIDFGATLAKHNLLQTMQNINNNNNKRNNNKKSKNEIKNNQPDTNTTSLLSITEIQDISKKLITMSDELIKIIAYERRAHVHHLRADLFIDQSILGNMNINNKNYKNKKKNIKNTMKNKLKVTIEPLKSALIEKEEEAKQLGDMCLVKVLIMLSDELCKLQQFETAFPYLQRAIKIHETNLGTNQVELGRYYSMYGQATASVHKYQEAIGFFKKSIKIFELYSESVLASSPYHNDLPLARQFLKHCQDRV